ncbi:MAG: Unknown protein [uncultured Aureispira sp.]|uniref:Uncharacterized protein n=1 Tax=uncultured Aureispira sp. TaxID=1331704 RepID=A0A6S6U9J7_9BACT|nr:MAG: Unknown protein [uncultured Aureispira sp.]
MKKSLIVLISSLLLLANSSTAQNWKSFYKRVTPLDENTFLVKRFDKHGVVDADGKVLIQMKYDTLITFPKGFVAEETIKGEKTKLLLSKTGKVIYTTPAGTQFLPYDAPAWKNAPNKVPLLKRVAGVLLASDYRTILPYQYLYIWVMGSSNSFFLAANEQEKWAVLDSSNQLRSDYIYTLKPPKELEDKFIVESVDKKKVPKHFYSNWVYKKDTLVCLSSLTGKELWQSTTPRHILSCDKGVHLVQPHKNDYGAPEYLIIDEVTQSVTTLDQGIRKVHTYLGNGQFYVSWKDGKNGTIDLNGKLQKEYSYTEVRKVPRMGAAYSIKASNVDFGDYHYALNENGVFLWSPSTNHRMQIGEETYFLKQYKLRPLSKSKRYWVLIESEDFSSLENSFPRSFISFSKLIICDSVSGKIVFSKKTYNKGGIRLEESSPSNDIWIINHNDYHDDEKISFFYKGRITEYENTHYRKLSSDGRFYKMTSYDFNQSRTNNARVFDTQKGAFVKYDIANAIFFGLKGKEVFLIKKYNSDGNTKEFYFADLELNKTKSLKLNIHDVRKIELTNNTENSVLEVSRKDADSNYFHGAIDANGNQIIPMEYGLMQCIYQEGEKYTFLTRRLDHSNSNLYSGLFISTTGEKSNCNSDKRSYLDAYAYMDVDSLHSCVFNFKSGQVSKKFKQGSINFHKQEGLVYIVEKNEESLITIYNANTFEPISPKPYDLSKPINPKLIIDFKTGKELTDSHIWAIYSSVFCIIYKNIEQAIDWDGNCVDGCD